MAETNDKELERLISQVVRRDEVHFDANQWKKKYPREVRLLDEWKTTNAGASLPREPKRWSTIMHSRLTKLVAASAVAAVVVLGIAIFAGRDSSSKLFAETLRQIQAGSYTFELGVKMANEANDGSTAVEGMVLEPGKVRLDCSGEVGQISVVFDTFSGKSLILFHRQKAAYDQSIDADTSAKMVGPLALFAEPIGSLWNLRDGMEKELGRTEIAGQPAEGFEIVAETDEYTQTITVWAHAETGKPLQVIIVMKAVGADSPSIEFTMRDFTLDVELDEELFSTTVPEGYTVANQRTLDELPSEETQSLEAEKILEMLDLWSNGKQREATDLMLAINWAGDIEFPADAYLFTLTERQYISLTHADQQQVMSQIIKQSTQLPALARGTVTLAREAQAAKDFNAAEKYLVATAELGRLLNRDSDRMLIVRLVGIAVQGLGLKGMEELYQETGHADKLQAARDRQRQLKDQLKAIHKSVAN